MRGKELKKFLDESYFELQPGETVLWRHFNPNDSMSVIAWIHVGDGYICLSSLGATWRPLDHFGPACKLTLATKSWEKI